MTGMSLIRLFPFDSFVQLNVSGVEFPSAVY